MCIRTLNTHSNRTVNLIQPYNKLKILWCNKTSSLFLGIQALIPLLSVNCSLHRFYDITRATCSVKRYISLLWLTIIMSLIFTQARAYNKQCPMFKTNNNKVIPCCSIAKDNLRINLKKDYAYC